MERQAILDQEFATLQRAQQELQQNHVQVEERQQQQQQHQSKLVAWRTKLEQRQEQLDAKAKDMMQMERNWRKRTADLKQLEQEVHDREIKLEQEQRSYQAQTILMEQTLEELRKNRQDEEERWKKAQEQVTDLNEQAQRIKNDSRAVKEALKTKLAESHKELSDLDEQIRSKQDELDMLESRLEEFIQEDEANRKLADEQAAENLEALHALQTKMDEIRNEMLIDEEAIVEQRREHEQLLQQMQKDTTEWEYQHEKRMEREKEEIRFLEEESQKQMDAQVHRAKEEIQALGDLVSAQKAAFETSYCEKMGHLEGLESAIRQLTANYSRDKEQLEKDVAENEDKQQKLDKLLARLEASEVQYKSREKELEVEIGRLNEGFKSEVRELQEKHNMDIAACTSRYDSLKHERDELEQEKLRLASKLQELDVETSEEFESLRLDKISLQKDLEQTMSQNSSLLHQLNALQAEVQGQHMHDAEEREKIQAMMSRLEVNGAAVAEKQRQLEEKEQILQEAGADLEHRLMELITLVRINRPCLACDWQVKFSHILTS